MPEMTLAARIAFEQGFAPSISNEGLQALLDALERDDPALVQGATTSPPPIISLQDCPVEAACAVTYCGWKGDGLLTVGEAEEFFAIACQKCGHAIGEATGARHFLNWFDETPRDSMRAALADSVRALLQERGQSKEKTLEKDVDS